MLGIKGKTMCFSFVVPNHHYHEQIFVGFLLLWTLFTQWNTVVTGQPTLAFTSLCSYSTKGKVDCTGRNLTNVPAELPPDTQYLILNKNNITALKNNSFRGIPGLQNLSMQHNLVNIIETGTFVNVPKLRHLDLTDNPVNISTMEQSVFSALPAIERLILRNMSFKLGNESLKGLRNTSIQFLDLSFNKRMCNLKNGTFSGLRSLKTLKIEFCQCPHLNTWAFEDNPNLTNLYLKYNWFADFPIFNQASLPALEVLDLNGSRIYDLDPRHLTNLPKLRMLQLSGNDINTFEKNLIYNLSQLETLYLDDNRLKKIYPSALRSNSLKVIHLETNRFILDNYHKNLFRNATKIEEIYLGDTGFDASVHEIMFQNLTTLKKLHMPRMRNFLSIPETMLSGLHNLQSLDLSHNLISHLNMSMFFNLSNLKDINLGYNQLTIVNVTSFPRTLIKELENLNLAGNPFQCTCELWWFIGWMNSTNGSLMGNPERYRCASPPHYRNKSLTKLNLNDHVCLTVPLGAGLVAAMVLSAATVIFTFIASAVIRYTWRLRFGIFHFKLWLKSKRAPSNPPDNLSYNFEVFVSYNSADSAWVKSMLVPNLEPTFRLCLFERDWLGGHDMVDCIQESIELSRFTLLIVTNSYARSQWSQLELTMAQHNLFDTDNEGVILAIMEDIDPMYMTPRLILEMNRRDYLEWTDDKVGQRLFWEKMENVLRSKKTCFSQSLPPKGSLSSYFT